MVEACHLKASLGLADVEESGMIASGDGFQRVAHLVVVEHPEVTPHKDVVGIALIRTDDGVERYAYLGFRLLLAYLVCQIAVDG